MMGSGDHKVSGHHMIRFHLHMPHVHLHHHHHGGGGWKREARGDIPKGCVAITVGQGEEQQRFVIPVIYVNHPLFMRLLKEAEEEYGFDQKGPINIPCHVEKFCQVRGMIDKEAAPPQHHHDDHHEHHHHHHHHHHHPFMCFKA